MPESIPIYNTKVITLLTGNERKKRSLEKAVKGFNVKIEIKDIWLPEIQHVDTEKVAALAARYGANLLKKPVVKMDSGFYIEELNGFPGTLVHIVDKQIGAERFFEILKNLKNRKAYIKNSFAYCEPGKDAMVFSSKCEGVIVEKLFSLKGSFIDRLFIPHHIKNKDLKTLGQIRKESAELFLEIWGDAELQFMKWFTKNP